MAGPLERHVHVNGIDLCYFEWPGEGRPIFLAHATGFHARCWDQVVAHLPGRRVVALDMRGHGRSEKVPPPYDWADFAADIVALFERLGLRGAIGAGHSKGGYAVAVASGLAPGAFASLVLVDPVVLPREAYGRPDQAVGHFAARRRNEWASPQEMFESFSPRPPFNTWDPAVLRDYCEFGLSPNPEGAGFVLACPPELEAATYMGAPMTDPYDAIANVDIPVRILRARSRGDAPGRDLSGSPTSPGLAGHFRHGEDVYLPFHSHFIPMEAPELVASHILALDAALPGIDGTPVAD